MYLILYLFPFKDCLDHTNGDRGPACNTTADCISYFRDPSFPEPYWYACCGRTGLCAGK